MSTIQEGFAQTKRAIFHYNVPVADIEAARKFYAQGLGLTEVLPRRRNDKRSDYEFFGHHLIIKEVGAELAKLQREAASHREVRHFGVFLPWEEWHRYARQLRDNGVEVGGHPEDVDAATPRESSFWLNDPSGNGIEFKTSGDLLAWFE